MKSIDEGTKEDKGFNVSTNTDKNFYERSLIVALGKQFASLNVADEKELIGKWVSYYIYFT